MSDTLPQSVTEQSSSVPDDFELIEKEETIAAKGSDEAIPDLIQDTQKSVENPSEKESHLDNVVGLEMGNKILLDCDSLVIIEGEIHNEIITAKEGEIIDAVILKETEHNEDNVMMDRENIVPIASTETQHPDDVITKDRENTEDVIVKDCENIQENISKETESENVITKDIEISDDTSRENRKIPEATPPVDRENILDLDPENREMFPEAATEDREIPEATPPIDHENILDLDPENREMFPEAATKDREIPEATPPIDRENILDLDPENHEIPEATPPVDRKNILDPNPKIPESSPGAHSENRETPEPISGTILKDDISKIQENIPENENLINPQIDTELADRDDAEVMDILSFPKDTIDSGLPDDTQQQQPKSTDKQTTDSSESSDIETTNIVTGDNTQDATEEVIQYTDRPNSTEHDQDITSYVYPLEQEFWEVEDVDDPRASHTRWRQLYIQLHARSNEDPPVQRVARMHQHRPLNRYSNILANDNTRIQLTHSDTNYINANLITMPEVDRSYIMTQGPLDITCEHFWLMVWHEECPGIVMLNRTVESGKPKCFQYFPREPGKQLVFGDFLIESTRQFETVCYRMSFLTITNLLIQQTRTITHFQYLSWPDFGAPQTPEDFLQFLVAVRERGLLNAEGYGPPVIHCSAGVGRSGTFILVDACLRRIEIEGHPLNVHVQDSILYMRKQRFGCIQSEEQLRFSYVAILVATHNLMADEPIATMPELVEIEKQEISISPIPPTRTSSRVHPKIEPDSTPPELPPRNTPAVHTPKEDTSTTTATPEQTITDNPFEDGVRERILPINEEIVEAIDAINEREFRISGLKMALGVVAITIGAAVFYMTFF